MTFNEFVEIVGQLRRDYPDAMDCAETRLDRVLSGLVPNSVMRPIEKVHRCHLATEWAGFFGFAHQVSHRALICSGVRDGLHRLFKHFAVNESSAILPSDNYPVFHEIAQSVGLKFTGYTSLPKPDWPSLDGNVRGEVMLITNPMKPLGRPLTTVEVEHLLQWLAVDKRRRLIIDTVYTFSNRFHSSTLALLESNQAILLNSLSKGWLSPRSFGVAFVPSSDLEALRGIFQKDAPSQEGQALARLCFCTFKDLPDQIGGIIERGRNRVKSLLPREIKSVEPSGGTGYFIVVQAGWRELLETHGVLGLPASVFGSTDQNLTVLSCLNSA